MSIILVCPGGGCRGKITTSFLNSMEDYFINQRIINSNEDINKFFDSYAGTSTGSLISAGLANNFSAKYINNYFYNYKNMKNIFNRTWKGYFGKRKYNPKFLYKLIDDNFKSMTIYDIKKTINIITFNYTKNKSVVFSNYEQNYNNLVLNSNNTDLNKYNIESNFKFISLASILKASSAAPTYFPAVQLDYLNLKNKNNNKGEELESQLYTDIDSSLFYLDDYFIDGTMCCNNPSTIAIDTEFKINSNINNNHKMLFVGNGYLANKARKNDDPSNYGSVDWFFKGNILDILMNADEEFNKLETEKILKDNYLHINIELQNIEQSLIDNVNYDNFNSLENLGVIMFYDNKEKIYNFIN